MHGGRRLSARGSGARIWIEAEDAEASLQGGPLVLLDTLVPETVPLFGLGAEILRLQVTGEGFVLRPARPGGGASRRTELMAEAAADVLAAVVRDQATAKRLARWWDEAAAPAPPIVVAESGAAALPALLRHALAEVMALSRRCAELELAAATARQDEQAERTALVAMRRVQGHAAPQPASLALEMPPADGLLEAGAGPWRAELPVAAHGLAAIALLPGGPVDMGCQVRLLGAESGQVLASWTVPPEAFGEGWLRLELPMPAEAEGESASLELAPVYLGDPLPPLMAARALPGQAAGALPALRVWAAAPGSRFVHARHFDWSAWEGAAPPAGTPLMLPDSVADSWQVQGLARLVQRDGADASRITLQIEPGQGEVRLLLPRIPLEEVEALRVELRCTEDAPAEAQAAIALLPPGRPQPGAAALVETGWRALARHARLRSLALSVPPGLAEAALAVRLRAEEDGGTEVEIGAVRVYALPQPDEAAALVEEAEWTALPPAAPPETPRQILRGVAGAPAGGVILAAAIEPAPAAATPPPAARPRMPAAPPPAPPPPIVESPPQVVEMPAPPQVEPAGPPQMEEPAPPSLPEVPPPWQRVQLDRAWLDGHAVGNGYELLDLQVANLLYAGQRWPRLKFKFSVDERALSLEFRAGEGLPRMFEEWPGNKTDAWGAVFHIIAGSEPFGHDRLRTEKDVALLQALIEALPRITAEALTSSGATAEEIGRWAEHARLFGARLQDVAGIPPAA